ncbi:MAG TPA: HU family DNA-binding protein [Smithellaceae bacterium]|nr:HU family DNA-binding protein [Smithellaceae bacterium]
MMKKGRMAGAGRKNLVDAVAEKTGITKENAGVAVKAVQESVMDLLQQSGKLQLMKFGSFTLRKTKQRQGRNPATGQPITIPAGYRIGFKVSKTWKDSMMLRKRAQEEKAAKPTASDARAAKPAAKGKARPAAGKNWKKR